MLLLPLAGHHNRTAILSNPVPLLMKPGNLLEKANKKE
jgi:hypothetical protein